MEITKVLLFFECIWMIYYASVNIAGYSISSVNKTSRQDIFALGSHIATVVAVAAGAHNVSFRIWIPLVFVFETLRDSLNMVNITWFSALQQQCYGLWIAACLLSWFQIVLDVSGLIVFIVLISIQQQQQQKTKKQQKFIQIKK
jgi:hypothetical protein